MQYRSLGIRSNRCYRGCCAIAYAVYRYLKPDYLEDFEDDFDDDFDDDFFEDEDEDDEDDTEDDIILQ